MVGGGGGWGDGGGALQQASCASIARGGSCRVFLGGADGANRGASGRISFAHKNKMVKVEKFGAVEQIMDKNVFLIVDILVGFQ